MPRRGVNLCLCLPGFLLTNTLPACLQGTAPCTNYGRRSSDSQLLAFGFLQPQPNPLDTAQLTLMGLAGLGPGPPDASPAAAQAPATAAVVRAEVEEEDMEETENPRPAALPAMFNAFAQSGPRSGPLAALPPEAVPPAPSMGFAQVRASPQALRGMRLRPFFTIGCLTWGFRVFQDP